jgi:hypothetical protein
MSGSGDRCDKRKRTMRREQAAAAESVVHQQAVLLLFQDLSLARSVSTTFNTPGSLYSRFVFGLDVDLQRFCFSSSLLDVFCFPSLCSMHRVSLLFASLHSVARSFRGEYASVVEEDHNHRCDKTCYNILFPSVMM